MFSSTLILVAAAMLAAEPADKANDAPQSAAPTVLLIVGAAGEPQFGEQFNQWANRIEQAAEQGGANLLSIGRGQAAESKSPSPASAAAEKNDSDNVAAESGPADAPPALQNNSEQSDAATTDREKLQALLAEIDHESDQPLWIVMIGHGTFDRREAKFNLHDRDVTAAELAEWLGPLKRPVAVIACFSSSAPFINQLAGDNRVLATATKSGYELNFSRFGDYFSAAVADSAADLDKDDQVSLLEAFLSASKQVEEFYAGEGRLATEQALIDDNGDGLGTPAAFFRGIRAVKEAKDGAELDGLRAAQLHLVRSQAERNMPAEVRQRRDEIERAIAGLREQKPQLSEDEYLDQLQPLLVELAELYERLAPQDASPTDDAASSNTPEPSDQTPARDD